MEISVIFVVLGAAFLHAFWNYQIRGTEDKALGMAAVVFGHLPLAILGLAFVVLPVSVSWPYVIASAMFHLGYQVGGLFEGVGVKRNRTADRGPRFYDGLAN